MKKIGVISDTHGNLQALQVALDYMKNLGCDEIIHTGDIVCIGPQSEQCVRLMLENNVVCIMGNHDLDFVQNNAVHKYQSHVAAEHKRFVFDSLEPYRKQIESFPFSVERTCGGKKVLFEHYCRPGNGYVNNGEPFLLLEPYPNMPNADDLDENYKNYNCDVVFYGHQHKACDIVSKKIYVDVGSLCCHPEALATGLIVSYDQTHFSYTRFALPYNKQLTEELMTNGVLPDGEYLYQRYFMSNGKIKSKYFLED